MTELVLLSRPLLLDLTWSFEPAYQGHVCITPQIDQSERTARRGVV